ncbi:TPM domain-containing protein [Qipengyuania oceanensis]|uniref:Methanol dehydrogenase n=1 Tax=Qipengyuania oceanensis TaxID=1463597 RepID=A0A844YEV6_9SPHN|nr:TPM domain-containing protein [Qipengyuania oceanensis]MXO62193.1 methanol dehydrogenase [Qipengyuania oceanensis]
MRRLALLFALVAGLLALPAWAQPSFPELTGRVVDNADLLSPEEEAQLTAQLEGLETRTQRQLVVATIPDLEGYDIADYGYQLGRAWGIGDAERNDGALLIVAPNDRKVRVEIGYGLEGVMTDALSSVIIQQDILPRFRDGDMAGGIIAGTDALVRQLELPEDEARAVVQQASESQSDGGFPIGAIIWIAFVFFFFVLPMLRGGKRYRRRGVGGAVGDIILWEAGKAIARGASGGGGGGWGGGGFGGGGGFSGGGGSFGGGGASGGW